MGHELSIEQLKNPEIYNADVDSVEVLQTHISFVALTGKFAYKIKKPVNFGFLDFSTVEKRKYFCEEEIRLNRRLCPDIYLDVVPITIENSNIKIQGNGEVIDYALKMKEFTQENIMTNLLKKDKIDEVIIDKICEILVDFYKSDTPSKEIQKFGECKTIKQNIDENFEQTKEVIGKTISQEIFNDIKKACDQFFSNKEDVFEKRVENGYIHDCHGDLHSGNIVVSDKVCIFDCIEFNKRFRYGDVASDIGFLAMDLDYLNYPYLSSYLIKSYVEKSNDTNIFDVLNFYKSYRAYVRGKVTGFKLNDSNIKDKEKKDIKDIAKKYYELSHYYSSLFSLNLEKPVLFAVNGLTGTGKSTVSMKLSIDYNAEMINTDVVRKKEEGIDKYERHHDDFNKGLYSPEKMDFVYKKVIEKASNFLKKGKNVVIDATFQKEKHRDMARKLAKYSNSKIIFIRCKCPDQQVKKWLDERLKKKTVSDGRWEIYKNQKQTFEPFKSKENYIEFNTSKECYNYKLSFFNDLIKMIKEDD